MTGSELADYAAAYRAAASRGRRPIADVAARFGVSQSTATRRLAEAREAGLLEQHVALTNPKMAAVAAALGVSVEALDRAVRDHADGRLYSLGKTELKESGDGRSASSGPR